MTQEDQQAMLDRADELLELGEYAKASIIAGQVLEHAGADEQSRAHCILGIEVSINVQYDLGLSHFREALAIAQSTQNLSLQSRALTGKGWLQQLQGEYESALQTLVIALHSAEQASDKKREASALERIGHVHLSLSDFASAREFMQAALLIYEDLGDFRRVARISNSIGGVYTNLSDYTRALEYFEKALSMFEEIENRIEVARCAGNIGSVYGSLSEYPHALVYYQKALCICEDLGDRSGVARNTGNMGVVHWSLSDYSGSLEYFEKALSKYEDLGDRRGAATNTGNIGLVYQSLEDYSGALEYLQKALSTFELLGDRNEVARNTGNIGGVYYNLTDYPHALEYMQRALSMQEDTGDRSGVANNTGNIGEVYYKLNDHEKALEYYLKGLQLHVELGEKSEAANIKCGIGELYADATLSCYDAVQAETYLLESIALSEELGTKKYHTYKILSQLYEHQGRAVEAIVQLKNYIRLKEEVQSDEAKNQMRNMAHRRVIAEQERIRTAERAAADATKNVLHKVLPASVAQRLVDGERVADYFAAVSILFADIVGFTPIASRMPAKAVLAFLNHVFGEFDRIVRQHGCEKIKTIGDGYLAVAGAPIECSDHAERIARCALEMMNDIELPDEIRKHLPKGSQFSLRIGVHTGSVFAGIVGEERFVYDIYSDAVNIAARMESHGEPGRIHCSDDFAHHLQNRDESFVFEERDEIEIKGKGMLRTYFLVSA